MESGKRSLFGAQVGCTPVRRFSSSPFVGRIHLSAMSADPFVWFRSIIFRVAPVLVDPRTNFEHLRSICQQLFDWVHHASNCKGGLLTTCWSPRARIATPTSTNQSQDEEQKQFRIYIQCIKKHKHFTYFGSNQVGIYTHYAQFDCVDQQTTHRV